MDVADLLRQLNIPYRYVGEHHHVTKNYIGIDCPYCSPASNKFRMGIHIYRKFAYCWICGNKNTVHSLALASGQQPKRIKQLIGSTDPHNGGGPAQEAALALPANVGDLKACHRDYLTSRGIDPGEASQLWGVRGIGLASVLSWRLFLPITHHQEIVSWTTRSLSSKGLRYITASPHQEKISARRVLYGADLAQHIVIVVEGPLDAIKIGPGAVATLGLSYSREQILLISRYPVRYICFDSEPEATKRAKKLCQDLSAFPGQTHRISLETGKDPGEVDLDELQALRRLLI